MKYSIIVTLIFVSIILYVSLSNKIVEGYESFEECKTQGYPHDFCMSVPIQSMITPA
jgi:hypothetical protein